MHSAESTTRHTMEPWRKRGVTLAEVEGRSAPASAHMQAPVREEMRRIPPVTLAHMQTSERVESRMRSGGEYAHMRTPVGVMVRARPDSTAAYMQPSDTMDETVLVCKCRRKISSRLLTLSFWPLRLAKYDKIGSRIQFRK